MVHDFRPNLRQVDSRDSSFSVRSSHLQLMFEVENGKILKRHVDHMRKRVVINEDRTSAQPDATIQDNFHYPSPTPPPEAVVAEPDASAPTRRYPTLTSSYVVREPCLYVVPYVLL